MKGGLLVFTSGESKMNLHNPNCPPPSLPAQQKQCQDHLPAGNAQPQEKDAQLSKPPGEVWMLTQQMCFSLNNQTGYRMRSFKHAGGRGGGLSKGFRGYKKHQRNWAQCGKKVGISCSLKEASNLPE